MIVLCCNNCESTKLERYEEGKRAEKGDWFICKECRNKFPLRKASYRQESDLYD